MNKPDARFLDLNTQNYLRQQAIRLREQGRRFIDIGAYLGVHRNTVAKWWQQYQQGGKSALKQRTRGAKYGEWRTLSQSEEETVQQLMLSHFPDELEIDSALWTRLAVQALIDQQYGVKMPIRTVGEYLKRWGFTPQKPQRARL
jgi:transposase